MNRVIGVARMQLTHPLVIFGIPWMVAGISFAVNVAVWGAADLENQPGSSTTGGLASLYITVLVVFVQAVTQMLPFAMGLSLSRRTFYLGTALVAAGQAVGYGLALTALTAVENASNGWGVGLDFWAPGALDVGNPALQVIVFAVPMLAFAFLGMGIGVVYKRWGAAGIWSLTLATLLGVGLLVVLVTWQQAWTSLWTWLTDRSVESLTLGLPAVVAVALAGLTYAGMRRTVP